MSPSRRNRRKGFTLIEALLAATVFTVAAFMLLMAFNNGQMSMLAWEENSEIEKIADWAIERIDIRSLNLDEIEKGGELTSVEGYRVEWKAQVHPTETLDLFVVEYEISVDGGSDVYEQFRETQLYCSDAWYEEDDRDKLVEEKEEYFKEIKEARKRR